MTLLELATSLRDDVLYGRHDCALAKANGLVAALGEDSSTRASGTPSVVHQPECERHPVPGKPCTLDERRFDDTAEARCFWCGNPIAT